MDISLDVQGGVARITLAGRLDSGGARELEAALSDVGGPACALVDMAKVNYLSSAGVRVFLKLARSLALGPRAVVLARPVPYVRQVLDLSGMAGQFQTADDLEEAAALAEGLVREAEVTARFGELPSFDAAPGRFTFVPGSDEPGGVRVLGRAQDVLHAAVTEDMLFDKRFSQTEYSLGLGGLGEAVEDYFGIMGEMITVGGTFVWLPTDGSNLPDYLIPRRDTGAVTLHTPFNVSIRGEFNELALFTAEDEAGAPLEDVYRALLSLARRRRSDFKGALAVAAWADAGEVYASGVRHAPVASKAPQNAKPITAPENIDEWFEIDEAPRHRGVTCLMVGVAADLSRDLSAFDRDKLDSVFYVHPAAGETPGLTAHTHGVMFSPLPSPEVVVDLDREIRKVVEQGDFLDMRHLLGATRLTRAWLGLVYIQDFERDVEGWRGVSRTAPAGRSTRVRAAQAYRAEAEAPTEVVRRDEALSRYREHKKKHEE